ncbi:uncharacterized protein F4822DRAFT_392547 [Hypoxylon trugodes]|uniref:uncharacterized protein n=1 Tax=Hypoxylon trugodes TaxID=326681 RepID=UPI00219C6BC0|nr:uncharacterized protein F4822DRAFT_392547 [Hypoxylon trugodes]KAI1392900.1 hypothetical protein F4822DRAFT_392547 [Hypoxylon trugodes]
MFAKAARNIFQVRNSPPKRPNMSEDATGLCEPLHSPDDANVDIVFVHGLGGHRVESWTYKPTEEVPVESFWPKDFLKSACPTARILSFGYDSHFTHFYPLFGPKNIPVGTTIDDHSGSLFLDLNNLRASTETPPERPLIFVAHSLGGLVVANALSRLTETNTEDKNLANTTFGVIFLGTPFEGASLARWGTIALNLVKLFSSTNKESVKDLQEQSQRLAAINDAFYKYIKVRDRSQKTLRLACFYEEWPTYVGRNNIGVVVPKASATLSGINPVPISASHSGMCKFADESRNGYKAVSGTLSRWIKELDRQGPSNHATGGVVHSGDMKFQSTVHNSGIITRDIDGNTPDAVRLTGTVNYYGSDYKPQS